MAGRFFSPLELREGDEEKVQELIKVYGYRRVIAAVIRNMDTQAGKDPLVWGTLEELGL